MFTKVYLRRTLQILLAIGCIIGVRHYFLLHYRPVSPCEHKSEGAQRKACEDRLNSVGPGM